MAAVSANQIAVVERLLKAGADINMKRDDRLSSTPLPLMIAVEYGLNAMVELLLKSGANVEGKNSQGYTALMIAARDGKDALVDILLTAGSQVDAEENIGMTALIISAYKGHTAVVDLLLKAGADANHRNNGGQTALMIAACEKRSNVEYNRLPRDTRPPGGVRGAMSGVDEQHGAMECAVGSVTAACASPAVGDKRAREEAAEEMAQDGTQAAEVAAADASIPSLLQEDAAPAASPLGLAGPSCVSPWACGPLIGSRPSPRRLALEPHRGRRRGRGVCGASLWPFFPANNSDSPLSTPLLHALPTLTPWTHPAPPRNAPARTTQSAWTPRKGLEWQKQTCKSSRISIRSGGSWSQSGATCRVCPSAPAFPGAASWPR